MMRQNAKEMEKNTHLPISGRQISRSLLIFLFGIMLFAGPSFADVCCTPNTCPAGQVCSTPQACAGIGAIGGACGTSGNTFCCTPSTPQCGNGNRERQEECDDGNLLNGDGCDSNCAAEPCVRGTCMDQASCAAMQGIGTRVCGFNLAMTCCALPVCGDNIPEGAEECDNGANNSDNGICTRNCRNNICGDGLLHTGVEQCDRGSLNGTLGSGCTASCQIQICGNSIIEPGEQCDNGVANGTPQDNCSAACQIVSACPSDHTCNRVLDCALINQNTECIQNTNCTNCCRCVPIPGCDNDGIVDPDEECDGPNSCPNGAICDSECLCSGPPPGMCNNDGIVDFGEECDGPGSCPNAGDICNNCQCSPPIVTCNDGDLDAGEQCDEPNNPCPNAEDSCDSRTCQCVTIGGIPAPGLIGGSDGIGMDENSLTNFDT